ncbi:MAG: DNA polymerase sliding clamp, partial [Methanobacteriaceae archaeon]|nr:DNA polymerase sliding clamp [Methanobacteriaceae archaeon]
MFKAELNDPNILRTSFDAISSIVDEVQIQVDSEGMRLDALDRSHITFVHLELKREIFDEYECDEPEKINVDTEELMKVLRRARAGDRLIITSDDANLILTFEGEATRQFKIRLIDIEYETPQPPEIR